MKSRRVIDRKLANKRYHANLEHYRYQSCLSGHKRRKQITVRRRDEQKDKYIRNMEETQQVEKYRKWTEGEIWFMTKNYKKMTILEIAKTLERTWGATSRKLNKLRLIKLPRRLQK